MLMVVVLVVGSYDNVIVLVLDVKGLVDFGLDDFVVLGCMLFSFGLLGVGVVLDGY